MKKQVKNQVAEVQEVQNEQVVNEQVQAQEVVVNENHEHFDFTNLEWLRNNSPVFPAELTSKKCKLDREPAVRLGARLISKINPDFPELLLLLAKWWENKPARKTIKAAIDAEAAEQGYDEVTYMQNVLKDKVTVFASLTEVVDRMKYAITYFKPREGAKTKEQFKQYQINGVVYNVSLTVLSEARNLYGDDKEAIKAYVVENSRPIEDVEEL